MRALPEDRTHGNSDEPRAKRMAANFFPRFFHFSAFRCWLPLLLPPWQELEDSTDETWHEVSTLEKRGKVSS